MRNNTYSIKIYVILIAVITMQFSCSSQDKKGVKTKKPLSESLPNHMEIADENFKKFLSLFNSSFPYNEIVDTLSIEFEETNPNKVNIDTYKKYISLNYIEKAKGDMDKLPTEFIPCAIVQELSTDSVISVLYYVSTDYSFWFMLQTYNPSGETIDVMDVCSITLDRYNKSVNIAKSKEILIFLKEYNFIENKSKIKESSFAIKYIIDRRGKFILKDKALKSEIVRVN